MLTRLSSLLLVAALALAGLPAAHAQIAVQSDLADDRTVAPGTSYRGTITIKNMTDKKQQAKVSVKDYHFTAAGTNSFTPPGSHARSNADWIEFRPRRATLPPHGTAEVEYEVAVPNESALADSAGARGTYWSVLMVEPIARGSAESTLPATDDQHAFGVQQVTRFGVQVATHLSTSAPPKVSVADANLVAEANRHLLSIDLENVGAAMTRPTLRLEVYAPDGEVVLQEEAPASRLYPETSVRHRLSLDGLSGGRYEALVVVDAGGERVVGTQYTLDL
jgi:hypothetical protein